MWVLSRKRLAYEWYLIRRANVKLDGHHYLISQIKSYPSFLQGQKVGVISLLLKCHLKLHASVPTTTTYLYFTDTYLWGIKLLRLFIKV